MFLYKANLLLSLPYSAIFLSLPLSPFLSLYKYIYIYIYIYISLYLFPSPFPSIPSANNYWLNTKDRPSGLFLSQWSFFYGLAFSSPAPFIPRTSAPVFTRPPIGRRLRSVHGRGSLVSLLYNDKSIFTEQCTTVVWVRSRIGAILFEQRELLTDLRPLTLNLGAQSSLVIAPSIYLD